MGNTSSDAEVNREGDSAAAPLDATELEVSRMNVEKLPKIIECLNEKAKQDLMILEPLGDGSMPADADSDEAGLCSARKRRRPNQ
ncbi:MAG: hypothetical protein OXC30_05215 [Alphaproteobacteria bacterium]|nr:hypothetical protein [Alphaproteobacteria bacterium]